MNVRGPCSSCGVQLATDQRYCVACGQRVGPPLALPYLTPAPAGAPHVTGGWLAALPMPIQMATTFAALALGFGVVLGTAISPNLSKIIASPGGPTVVAEQPPAEAPSSAGGGGGSGGAPRAAAPAAVASTSTASPVGGGGRGGGGGHKKRKKKKQPETAQTFSGTVVRVNPVAHSYTIATGGLIAIHADSLPDVGAKLEVPARRLANGTYAESGARNRVGTAESAQFGGVVTYCADLERPAVSCADSPVEQDHYVYAVSGVGASVLVSAPHPANTSPPNPGARVDVTVQIGSEKFKPIDPTEPIEPDPDCAPPPDGLPDPPVSEPELTQTAVNVTDRATEAILEAVVQLTCRGDSPKLILSADDVRQSERDLPTLGVPSGIDLGRLTAGQAVQAAVELASDGRLTLEGIASDQGAAGADDPTQGQGTLTGS